MAHTRSTNRAGTSARVTSDPLARPVRDWLASFPRVVLAAVAAATIPARVLTGTHSAGISAIITTATILACAAAVLPGAAAQLHRWANAGALTLLAAGLVAAASTGDPLVTLRTAGTLAAAAAAAFVVVFGLSVDARRTSAGRR
jgi:hypothetical protein